MDFVLGPAHLLKTNYFVNCPVVAEMEEHTILTAGCVLALQAGRATIVASLSLGECPAWETSTTLEAGVHAETAASPTVTADVMEEYSARAGSMTRAATVCVVTAVSRIGAANAAVLELRVRKTRTTLADTACVTTDNSPTGTIAVLQAFRVRPTPMTSEAIVCATTDRRLTPITSAQGVYRATAIRTMQAATVCAATGSSRTLMATAEAE